MYSFFVGIALLYSPFGSKSPPVTQCNSVLPKPFLNVSKFHLEENQQQQSTMAPHFTESVCEIDSLRKFIRSPQSALTVLSQSFLGMRRGRKSEWPDTHIHSCGCARLHSAFLFQLLFCKSMSFSCSVQCHVFLIFMLLVGDFVF